MFSVPPAYILSHSILLPLQISLSLSLIKTTCNRPPRANHRVHSAFIGNTRNVLPQFSQTQTRVLSAYHAGHDALDRATRCSNARATERHACACAAPVRAEFMNERAKGERGRTAHALYHNRDLRPSRACHNYPGIEQGCS